ncbi:MAG: PDZ domain-containing protein [Gemmataceae bacterium]
MPLRTIAAGLCCLLAAGALRAQELNEATEKAVKAAVAKVSPCVVQIETSGGAELVGAGQVRKGVGPTTGVIVSPDGYIITSAFNFSNKPAAVFVSIPNRHKERLVAKTIATDETRMLTLIKVEASGLPVPTAVPKKEMQIGQWAIAIGRTLDPNVDAPPSASVGIISALNRIWGKAVQTDAKVSPVNYGGALIDVDGRVQGILVPASPFGEGDTAGVEWYDSGIGFAIPLEDVFAALPRLKQGKNLRRGLLGITPSGTDIYSGHSTVKTVALESAAEKAGIKAGDQIIEVDGKPVQNHAQLQHALGPKYEGDTVSVKVLRGKDTKEFKNLVLSGSLTAYTLPFLGILPMRDDPEPGLEIRAVLAKTPAEQAGLKPGDRIMKVGPGGAGVTSPLFPFAGRDQMMAFLAAGIPGAEVKLEVKRKADGKTESITVRLGVFETSVPDSVPEQSSAKKALEKPKTPAAVIPAPAKPGDSPTPPKIPMPDRPRPNQPRDPKAPKDAKDPAEKVDAPTPPKKDPKNVEKGLLKRTNQARDHEFWVYVPENYDPNVSHGLVIWLHAAGKGGKDADNVVEIWQEYCERYHLILVGPRAENDSGWVASESEFIAGTARDLMNEYTIDRQRVVVHGMGIGGQMAFYLAFHARDLIRGVATSSAILATQVKETVQSQRLAFFVVAGGKDPLTPDIKKSQAALGEKKHPVIFREIAEMGREYLDRKTLEEIIRWIDSLDRM